MKKISEEWIIRTGGAAGVGVLLVILGMVTLVIYLLLKIGL